jgi:uncharacterized membrane protein (UPF0136 family)
MGTMDTIDTMVFSQGYFKKGSVVSLVSAVPVVFKL